MIATMICTRCGERFHYEVGQVKVRCRYCGHVQQAEKQRNTR